MSDNTTVEASPDTEPETGPDTGVQADIQEWSARPWMLTGLLGLAGLLVHIASDGVEGDPWRMALTAALVFGPLALAFVLSPQTWKSASVFALAVAAIMAGIAWRATNAGDRFSDEQFWVASGVICITLALPLFQAGFHRLRWSTSYKATHFHVWTDAISGVGALAFVGLSWLVIVLLANLFQVIQIDFLDDLIEEEWFGWIFSGAAFGASLGVLRNQLKVIGTLQNVVLLVLSILAVPLAIALVIFLVAVLVSGLDVLWEATRSATPLLLAYAVGCFVLANAVVRDDDAEASDTGVLRVAGFVLAVGILPLSVMAAVSMGTRIDQHGLSPERLWALVAIGVAVTYGVAYFVSAVRGRRVGWRNLLRQANMHLAIIICGVALLLAMPVFNFGAISASHQLNRLASGAVNAEDFDYRSLRWDFGDAGRLALAKLVKSDNAEIAQLAKDAQESTRRYGQQPLAERRRIAEKLDILSLDEPVAKAVRAYVQDNPWICREGCRAENMGEMSAGTVVYLHRIPHSGAGTFLVIAADSDKAIALEFHRGQLLLPGQARQTYSPLDGEIEIRPFVGQQVFIDSKPASEPFKIEPPGE